MFHSHTKKPRKVKLLQAVKDVQSFSRTTPKRNTYKIMKFNLE